MQLARNHLLAGASRAGDQDPAPGRRDPLDLMPDLIDRAGLADQLGTVDEAAAQLRILPLQPAGLDSPLDHQQQPVGLERLLDKVVGAVLDRSDSRLDGAVAADHHDRQGRELQGERPQQLQPVESAVPEPNVEDDDIGLPGLHGRQGGVGISRLAGAMAFVIKQAADQQADVGLIVDDQYVVGHGCPVGLRAVPGVDAVARAPQCPARVILVKPACCGQGRHVAPALRGGSGFPATRAAGAHRDLEPVTTIYSISCQRSLRLKIRIGSASFCSCDRRIRDPSRAVASGTPAWPMPLPPADRTARCGRHAPP